MSENADFYDDNNDATASAFGWDFQASCGIFLFIKFFDNFDNLVMEGKKQDIEITFINGKKIYCQAKAAQFDDLSSRTTKLKNALYSLMKTNADIKKDSFLFITNLNPPIEDSESKYLNKIYSIDSKKDLKLIQILNAYKKDLIKDLENNNDIDSKNKKLIEKLNDFDVSNLKISSLSPYFDEVSADERMEEIYNQTFNLLISKFSLKNGSANMLKKELANFWHNNLLFDCSHSNDYEKRKTKKQLCWPIVLLLDEVETNIFNIKKIIDSEYGSEELLNAKRYFNDFYNTMADRFDSLNKVLRAYSDFSFIDRKDGLSKRLAFAKDNWQLFADEFANSEESEIIKEIVAKYFVYRIVCNYENIVKIRNGLENENS